MYFKKMALNIQQFAEDNGANSVTQTAENTEDNTVTQTDDKTEENNQVKTFTQEEANSMLKKERKKIPDKEELKAFNEWKESQKTDEDKKTELTQENVTLKSEKQNLEQLISIMEKGIDKDTAEFIQFKVAKMEGDFDDNLEDYLKSNPKYLKNEKDDVVEKETTTTTGVAVNKNTTNSDNGVSAILKAKYPELYK